MGVHLTEVPRVCYACGSETSANNRGFSTWAPNRDLVTWRPINYLCHKCYNRLIVWPNYFNSPAPREKHKFTSNVASRKTRITLVQALGGCCSCKEPDCWHQGHCTVTDLQCLQIDHINGGGSAVRALLKGWRIYRYYLVNEERRQADLQLLCANCNWKKKYRNHEMRGS